MKHAKASVTAVAVTALALVLTTPAPSMAQNSYGQDPATTNQTQDNDQHRGFDPGWLGLLGVLGLFGLKRRHTYDVSDRQERERAGRPAHA